MGVNRDAAGWITIIRRSFAMPKSKSSILAMGVKGTLILGMVALAGCASSSGGIEARQISASKYSNYSCKRLGRDGRRVSSQALKLAGKVDKRASKDQVAMGVAVILFWPAVFLVRGDGPEAEEYAELVGERNAIEAAARRKGCKIKFASLKSKENAPKTSKKPAAPSNNFAERKGS